MADDIVTRLRHIYMETDDLQVLAELAADEIERLHAELADAYDACRYALADSPRWQALAETVVHTWEARHG